ncbi:MAG: exosortase K [Flammeovirgaceae bacterium]
MNLKNAKIQLSTIVICLIALAISIALKLFYRQASVDELKFLLAPTSWLVSGCSSLDFDYVPQMGYFHKFTAILINKSCAGMNFWVITFSLSVLTSIRYYNKVPHQILLLIFLVVISFMVTILANTCRIIISIFLLKLERIFSFLGTSWWHTFQGAFIYLTILIIFYSLSQYIHLKITKYHEKPA